MDESQLTHNCGESNINDVSVNESNSKISIPRIDLRGIHDDPILRDTVVRKVQNPCKSFFFQVINHGIVSVYCRSQ